MSPQQRSTFLGLGRVVDFGMLKMLMQRGKGLGLAVAAAVQQIGVFGGGRHNAMVGVGVKGRLCSATEHILTFGLDLVPTHTHACAMLFGYNGATVWRAVIVYCVQL